MYAFITLISALGLNLIYGYAGLFSLGHAAFQGIGAYASALITYEWLRRGLEIPIALGFIRFDIAMVLAFLVAIVVGSLLAGAVAFVVGQPLLKLKSDYLCVGTLGFNVIVYVLLNNSDQVIPVMKGARGMVGIPRITTWPWVFAAAVVTAFALRNLAYSGFGRAISSMKESETAAESVGIDSAKYRTLAFVIGCTFAGLSGTLYAHLYGFLHPSTFAWIKSVDPFLIVVLGGSGSMTGTIIAAFGWTFVLEGLRVLLPQGLEAWRYVIYPLVMLVVMLVKPEGLLAGLELAFLRNPGVHPERRTTHWPLRAEAGSPANPGGTSGDDTRN